MSIARPIAIVMAIKAPELTSVPAYHVRACCSSHGREVLRMRDSGLSSSGEVSGALWQKSACELSDGIRRKAYSCRDVMDSVVGRIRSKNGALNAIVYDYTEEALAEAARADDDLAAGRLRGPLHGIPVTIKENVDQRGTPTPNGMEAFAGT